MHVDNFINNYETDAYASWFFMLHRFPAVLKNKFQNMIEQYELYCDYENERYRITGASRLGDIWLTKDFTQSIGYQKRVNIDECNNFSKTI